MRFCLICLCLCFLTGAQAQNRFRMVSYNVENLFDTRHDSLKEDMEFLPDAPRQWTAARYRRKLEQLSKVIVACGGLQLPDVVGLCEVENDSCLTHLTTRSLLRKAGYRYVMTDSPDQRGVDVALLYQPLRFRLVSVQTYTVPTTHTDTVRNKPVTRTFRPTRDILHVTGLLPSLDTLDVMVCHLPSRSGGKEVSEPHRLLAAGIIRQVIDSLYERRVQPRIVVMGDFNDTPTDRSIRQVLQAVPVSPMAPDPHQLYCLTATLQPGTYRYQGEWSTIDQFVVNGALLPAQAQVFMPPWLLQKDDTHGGYAPRRTYRGTFYAGGFSDHLPIYMDLSVAP